MKLRLLFSFLFVALMFSCNKNTELRPVISVPTEYKNLIFNSNGDEGVVVKFSSSQDWTAAVVDQNDATIAVDWASVSPASGNGSNELNEVTLTVSNNNDYSDKSARLVITSGNVAYAIKINQAQLNGAIAGETKYTVAGTGGTVSVEYQANIPLTATIKEADKSWLSISKAMSDRTINFVALANPLETNRTAVVTLSGEGVTPFEVTINQVNHLESKRVGIYFLSEGTFGQNNSTLSFYDLNSEVLTVDYFGAKNEGEIVGDTAQDIIPYGGKTYIVSNMSDEINIINSYNGKLLKKITLTEGGQKAEPRMGVGADGKVYVSTYHAGLAVIDTTELEIVKNITLAQKYSEGVAYYNGNVYVANAGIEGDPYGGNGNTISVISTETDSETKTITVPANPNILKVSKDGKMYLTTWGNFWSVDAQLHEVDYINGTYTTFEGMTAKTFGITDKYIYTYNFSYITYQFETNRINRNDNSFETFMEDPNDEHGLRSIYAIESDPATNDVFFTCESGHVVWFNEEGVERKSFDVKVSSIPAMRTNSVVFLDLMFEKE